MNARLKTIIFGAIALVALVVGLPSSCTYINPGHVGVVIRRTAGGVDPAPLGPGIHLVNPLTTGIEEYPTYMQTLVLTKSEHEGSANDDEVNVNSKEGQPVSMDISLSFEIDPLKTPQLYTTFRSDIDQITHSYVKQTIRQGVQEIVGQEEIAGIIGPKKAELVARTQGLLAQRLSPYGIVVKQFTVNELRPPKSIVEAIERKNAMQQEALTAQNELQKSQFQAQGDSIKAAGHAKAQIAEAEGKARANQLLQQSITPGLLELRRIEVQRAMVDKWNGGVPTTVLGSGGVPLLQLPNK